MLTKLQLAANNFKVTTHYWDHDYLTIEDQHIRNFPAAWIKKTIEFLEIIGGKTVVEIGSTRLELTPKCIDYYNVSEKTLTKDAPACCQDGHSTFFWARAGFVTHTVDVNEHCRTSLQNQYHWHLHEPFPANLHMHIPQDGIEFLEKFEGKIDLLYLDGWDKGTGNYAENHLKAYLAAKDKLSPMHLISVDDADFNTESAGKDALLTPHLIDNDYIKLISGRQVVFFKG